MNHADTVRAIYQAFAAGDAGALLARIDPAVEWEYGLPGNDVPWLQAGRGHAAVGRFLAAFAALAVERFEPTAILAGPDVAVALLDVAFTVRATGRVIRESDEVHVWRFGADGRVVRFTHKLDVVQHQRALQP